MKQGTTKKLKPKDKHTTAAWKKRDESRKMKQEEYALSLESEREQAQGDPHAEMRVSENV